MCDLVWIVFIEDPLWENLDQCEHVWNQSMCRYRYVGVNNVVIQGVDFHVTGILSVIEKKYHNHALLMSEQDKQMAIKKSIWKYWSSVNFRRLNVMLQIQPPPVIEGASEELWQLIEQDVIEFARAKISSLVNYCFYLVACHTLITEYICLVFSINYFLYIFQTNIPNVLHHFTLIHIKRCWRQWNVFLLLNDDNQPEKYVCLTTRVTL